MLDFHLAQLYDVTTKVLVHAVKRNIRRFPSNFAFQITQREYTSLWSQIVTTNGGRGGRRYLPYAFTEQGIVMLASVLRSQRAIDISLAIICTFVKLRALISAHSDLAHRLAELERKAERHDGAIQQIFAVTHQIMKTLDPPRRHIGFRVEEKAAGYRMKKKKAGNKTAR